MPTTDSEWALEVFLFWQHFAGGKEFGKSGNFLSVLRKIWSANLGRTGNPRAQRSFSQINNSTW
jgi:hypothetical protein